MKSLPKYQPHHGSACGLAPPSPGPHHPDTLPSRATPHPTALLTTTQNHPPQPSPPFQLQQAYVSFNQPLTFSRMYKTKKIGFIEIGALVLNEKNVSTSVTNMQTSGVNKIRLVSSSLSYKNFKMPVFSAKYKQTSISSYIFKKYITPCVKTSTIRVHRGRSKPQESFGLNIFIR